MVIEKKPPKKMYLTTFIGKKKPRINKIHYLLFFYDLHKSLHLSMLHFFDIQSITAILI
jgi:hypothetical protein